MAAQKPLHQLLLEDQEPFLLNNYIADRRCQLNKPPPPLKTHLQLKKLPPVSVSHSFCNNACFFSINNSPDLTKSPIFEFKSPAKSPCNKTPNSIFLHVPAKTAALLLEAAVRIQKQSSSKAKNSNGFGLFGSLIKRITHRKKREIRGGATVKNILNLRKLKAEEMTVNVDEKSSGVWSESKEDKSWDLDLETSISSQSNHEEEEFVNRLINSKGFSDFACFDDRFCDSPFHFVLRRSPSSGHRTSVFTSPAPSPNRCSRTEKVEKEEEELEEEKEQCSPVSVLDPPFEDDDDANDDHCQDDGFNLQYSYAFVQRTKQQLLQKLRRFEKLAELDPVELEKRMQEQEHDDDYTEEEEEEEEEQDDHYTEEEEEDVHDMIIEQLSKTSFGRTRKIPTDMKRLVSDLISEEEEDGQGWISNTESMAKRVWKRLEGWKEVESNTIDMMVEEDFKKKVDEWKKYEQVVGEAALEIEVSIFKILVDELSEELVGSTEI